MPDHIFVFNTKEQGLCVKAEDHVKLLYEFESAKKKITALESALRRIISVAERCDSWEPFPVAELEADNKALEAPMPEVKSQAEGQEELKASSKIYTIRIGKSLFRCPCGCNVFHKPDKDNMVLYCCNSCETYYEAVDREEKCQK